MSAAGVDNWDDHWREFGAGAEMGPSPRYRRRLIWQALAVPAASPGVRMLELGSGRGEFAEEFCSRFPRARFLGVELSHVGVEAAARRVPGAVFLQRDLLQPALPGQSQRFEATHALCSEVLEHLDDPVLLLGNAAAYMAKGCRLVVTVPGGPMNEFYRHIGHRRHYSPAELARLLETSGFEVEAAWGVGFPFFNLFRMILTVRGKQLIRDLSGRPSVLARLAMAVFDLLFRLNLRRWGWQTLAIARYRG